MKAALMVALASATRSISAFECTREHLRETANKYVFMQWSGHHSDFDNIAYDMIYLQNNKTASILNDVPAWPLNIAFNRSIMDTKSCKTFTELIVTGNFPWDNTTIPHPYVIHTQMTLNDEGDVSLIDSIVTDKGDWAFNATGTYYWNSIESWPEIPEEKRLSPETLKAIADTYPDRCNNKSVIVPFGVPCARLEGGAYTGRGNLSANTCDIGGLPERVPMINRRYVVDEVMGTVDIFMGFTGLDRTRPTEGTPDSHLFRIEDGKIRYIHTASACFVDGCGMNGTGLPPGIGRRF